MISRCKFTLIICLLSALFFPACVHDDDETEKCDQGLNISFYSQTRCSTSASYPENIKDLTIFVFNSDDVVVERRRLYDQEIGADFSETVDIGSGLYSVAAWSGLNDYNFDVSDIEIGVTKKNELLFKLRRTISTAVSLEDIAVYYGESTAVYVQEKSTGMHYEDIAVNLLEITNRITISVEGLPEDSGPYGIAIESNNGSMNIDGTIAEDGLITYEPAWSYSTSDILSADFTLLKLETGFENTIVITDTADGTELFRGSLLGALILKNPYVDLNCDHDFTIRFTAEDQCDCGTYTIAEIWVNNWLVHSYDTPMKP
ncbi:MAG: FimB/Mfa2 family fimbrial subunit [Rikenellaceae bacterium]|nr:FimB/Mfa2 family fimbrial subunit [Rikenellaceae bacterium]